MKIFYLTINLQIALHKIKYHIFTSNRMVWKLLLRQIMYFVAFIIATSKEFNSNQLKVLLQSYGQHAGET